MLFHHTLFLLFNAHFLLLNFLLLVDDSQELVSFLLGLLSQSAFSIHELLLSCLLQLSQHIRLLLKLSSLLVSCKSFTLFEGSLGSEGVNL